MPDLIRVVNMVPKLSSGETNQDSEPNLAVNPANPLEMAATAFTPSPNGSATDSPIFFSSDGGNSWQLMDIIAGTPVRDQTLRFASTGGMLYAGVLWGGGGNIALINFDILRTNDFSGLTTMTVLANRKNDDQPFVQAATVPGGPDAGKDRVYVGSNDHAPSNVPATIDQSLDAAVAAPTTQTLVIEERSVSRDGFQTRPAVHPDGVVYAIYYALTGGASSCDVVIVRDDDWASGSKPYHALIDTDGKQGIRIVTGANNPFLSMNIGQQRIGGDLSIAVDPRHSGAVYVCWGDLQSGSYTLHVRKSTDAGATWSADLRTVTNATNPALAINDEGRLGFLYQQVTGASPSQRWVTTLELTQSDFATITTHFLANTPAATPPKTFDPYLGDYLYMMTVGSTFYGIFCANNTPDTANFPNGVKYQRNANFSTHTLLAVDDTTPVSTSIDPFFFKVLVKYGKLVTAIVHGGQFGHVCLGSSLDQLLTINNSGNGELHITNIVSSSPDFLAPSVASYPIALEPGDSVEVVIRFQPTSLGAKFGTLTILSDDPTGPHKVSVSGDAPAPTLALAIADAGNFGKVCVDSFADELLLVNNKGHCPLSVTGVSSSSAEFLVPQVLSLPLSLAPGDTLPLPIRFAPTSFGAKTAKITVSSNDPSGAHAIEVRGEAPAGKLAVTGSLCFGGVKACCRSERTISICNVGECSLHVTRVAFKRKSRHWKLINNPFPAPLHPGSCLGLTIRYKATERCPIACELLIESDDPTTPVKSLDVMAYTIWDACCDKPCGDCRKGECDKCRRESSCEGCADDCCTDEDDSDREEH
jgi:Cep192 domain 4/Abnormal spindle-like microcephaly-assoc'd, ASPM-SPD-2-Hydin